MTSRAAWANAIAAIEAQRPAHPRHRRARPRRARGGAGGELRGRGRLRSGQGLRRRPDDLRRGGAGLDDGRHDRRREPSPRWPGATPGSARVWDKARARAREAVAWQGDKGGERHDGNDPADRGAGDDALASVQMTEDGERFIEGVWAIFGHGNVAGIGEALHGIGDALPTWRGQNEQTMAHAAIAYAKTKRRRRAMAVTSSIGPGALNMVTAAALAHVNRLPVLLHPRRRLRQPPARPGAAADRGFRRRHGQRRTTASARSARYFDRITRPEQLLTALPRALRDDDRSGRLRPGHARLLPGRAGRGLRLSRELLRAAGLAHPPARARPGRGRRRRRRDHGGEGARSSSPAAACSIPAPRTGSPTSPRRTTSRSSRPRPARAALDCGASDELRLARRDRLGLRPTTSARRPIW